LSSDVSSVKFSSNGLNYNFWCTENNQKKVLFI
jgi:hypothetical protein